MTKGQWHRILTQLGGSSLYGMYGMRYDFPETYLSRISIEICTTDDRGKLPEPKLVCFEWKWVSSAEAWIITQDTPETDLTNYTKKELVDFVREKTT